MKTKQSNPQVVINVERDDKELFNDMKKTYHLSDKEMFSVLLESQEDMSEEYFKSLVDKVVKAKQIAKIKAKIAKMEAKINTAKAEAVAVEPEEVEDLTPLIVVG